MAATYSVSNAPASRAVPYSSYSFYRLPRHRLANNNSTCMRARCRHLAIHTHMWLSTSPLLACRANSSFETIACNRAFYSVITLVTGQLTLLLSGVGRHATHALVRGMPKKKRARDDRRALCRTGQHLYGLPLTQLRNKDRTLRAVQTWRDARPSALNKHISLSFWMRTSLLQLRRAYLPPCRRIH